MTYCLQAPSLRSSSPGPCSQATLAHLVKATPGSMRKKNEKLRKHCDYSPTHVLTNICDYPNEKRKPGKRVCNVLHAVSRYTFCNVNVP